MSHCSPAQPHRFDSHSPFISQLCHHSDPSTPLMSPYTVRLTSSPATACVRERDTPLHTVLTSSRKSQFHVVSIHAPHGSAAISANRGSHFVSTFPTG